MNQDELRVQPPHWLQLWAKTTQNQTIESGTSPHYHPLLYQMLDVAAVAGLIFKLTPLLTPEILKFPRRAKCFGMARGEGLESPTYRFEVRVWHFTRHGAPVCANAPKPPKYWAFSPLVPLQDDAAACTKNRANLTPELTPEFCPPNDVSRRIPGPAQATLRHSREHPGQLSVAVSLQCASIERIGFSARNRS